ncbi:MAG: hemerythrin family protein [Sterolibacterium sp.]
MRTAIHSALWKDDFVIGDSLLDYEHQMIVGLIENCVRLVRNGEAKAQVVEILRITESYLAYHFHGEESSMEDDGDNRFDIHRQQHRHLLAILKERIFCLENGHPSLTAQQVAFELYDWYVAHLMQEDIKLMQ